MTEEKVELKPCPFCGHTRIRLADIGRNNHEFAAWCVTCGVESGHRTTKASAVKAWNTRTPEIQRDELLKAARALISAEPNTLKWGEAMADLMMLCQGGH